MARQRGIIKLKGTISDITFYKTKDGYMAKEKSLIEADRIASDAAFLRTRENNQEFKAASKAGKVFRTALRGVIKNAADNRVISRLLQQFFEVLQADKTSVRGQRNVIDGEALLLNGFEFNIQSKLDTCFHAPYTTTIDRVAGSVTIHIPAFTPLAMVTAPAGATHFKIISAAAEIDFENAAFTNDTKDSGYLPLDNNATAVIDMALALTAASTHPLFALLGVAFYQEVNDVQYPLNNGSYNALSVVKVDA